MVNILGTGEHMASVAIMMISVSVVNVVELRSNHR